MTRRASQLWETIFTFKSYSHLEKRLFGSYYRGRKQPQNTVLYEIRKWSPSISTPYFTPFKQQSYKLTAYKDKKNEEQTWFVIQSLSLIWLSILYHGGLKSHNKNMVGRKILEAVRWRMFFFSWIQLKAFIKFKGQSRRIKDGQETVRLLPVLFSCKFSALW